MKKRIIASVLVILLLLCTGCHKATLENYKLFRSTPLGFSMEYPSFWSKENDNAAGLAVFAPPAEGLSDNHLDSVAVQRFVLDMDGENAYNDYLRGYVDDLHQKIKNYSLVSETDTTLGGKDAYQIVYESTTDEKEIRFMQLFAENDGYVYVVTYNAAFNSYEYFMTNVEQMLSTFTFI